MKKRNRKIMSVFLSCAIGCQLVMPVLAEKDKSKVEAQKSELEENLNEVNETIDGLKSAKEELQSAVVELDTRLNGLTEQLDQLGSDLEQKEQEIQKTQKKLKKAKETEKEQYEAMKKRIRYMYENGDYASIEMLMSSKSITDLLNNAEYIAKITEYDRSMLTKYQETKDKVARRQQKLKEEYEASKSLQAQVQDQEAQVQSVMTDKKGEIEQYTAQISENEALALEYANEVEAQNAVLAEIQAAEVAAAEAEAAARAAAQQAEAEAQRKAAEAVQAAQAAQTASDEQAREQAQAEADRLKQEADAAQQEAWEQQQKQEQADNSVNAGGGGGFVWPCPSSYTITSDFGGRESPTAGASSNHQGIDIGAPSGSPIVAAASGTVTVSQYSPSAGNYVVISHGNGLSTVYMHASALYVSVGQSVSAGETIAAVGSTGYSTGAHLHFGVSVNGSYVNPHSYVG